MAALKRKAPVVLFGYDSSAFTQKIRLALRLKQIPYTFVLVPSMMPRPILRDMGITYRKIPIIFLGREAYIDTSLITEALEFHYTTSSSSTSPSSQQQQHPSLYPASTSTSNSTSTSTSHPHQRTLTRLLTSYWTDRPLFRSTCGLMPSSVWRSAFGRDRAGLIGHTLDPDKLERKIPAMMSGLDMHLSLLESLLAETAGATAAAGTAGTGGGVGSAGTGDGKGQGWVLNTPHPSLLDISIFYQLDWGREIAKGNGVADLTAGEVADGGEPGAEALFERYPFVEAWYTRTKEYFARLPTNETRVERGDEEGVARVLRSIRESAEAEAELDDEDQVQVPLLATPAGPYRELDERNGLRKGARISIAPVDTGMNDPSFGRLVAATPEEVVIVPDGVEEGNGKGEGRGRSGIRLHFPRTEFRARPVVEQSKL